MAYLNKPSPMEFVADELDKPFWEAAGRHQLVVHQCQICKKNYWPASCCLEHGGEQMEWVRASGRGVVYTYTVIHRPFLQSWQKDIPYNMAVIELEEGPCMFTNIIDCENDHLRCGMPVEVVWEDIEPGVAIPKFRPSDGA